MEPKKIRTLDPDANACLFCKETTILFSADAQVAHHICTTCGAAGPVVSPDRADCQEQSRNAWNFPGRFGSVAVAMIPPGLPREAMALAERLRIVAEHIMEGRMGEPLAMALVLRGAKTVTVTLHNMSDANAHDTLAAVLHTSKLRAGIAVKPSNAQEH